MPVHYIRTVYVLCSDEQVCMCYVVIYCVLLRSDLPNSKVCLLYRHIYAHVLLFFEMSNFKNSHETALINLYFIPLYSTKSVIKYVVLKMIVY